MRIDFREAINECPADVSPFGHQTIFLSNEKIRRGIQTLEIRFQTDDKLNPLEILGLELLIGLYQQNVGEIEGL